MITRPLIIRPYPTGACAPSENALAAVQPLPLDAGPYKERLNGLERVDLIKNKDKDKDKEERYRFWPARIQGQRQTCVAFAAAACIELLRGNGEPPFEALSPQFLYWYMRTSKDFKPEDPPPGWNEGATKLGQAKDVLIAYGISTWKDCSYRDRLDPGDPDPQGPEPSGKAMDAAADNRITDAVNRVADADGKTFYLDCPDGKREPDMARMVYELLAKERPVAIAIPVFYSTSKMDPLETNWDNPVTTNSGEVIDPVAKDWTRRKPDDAGRTAPGHAVCIVGFQPDDSEPTGGWFIFRNSRGMNWAGHADTQSAEPPIVPARGYGAISATYVEQYCWEIFSPVMRV